MPMPSPVKNHSVSIRQAAIEWYGMVLVSMTLVSGDLWVSDRDFKLQYFSKSNQKRCMSHNN